MCSKMLRAGVASLASGGPGGTVTEQSAATLLTRASVATEQNPPEPCAQVRSC
jgi:hypothetical protein